MGALDDYKAKLGGGVAPQSAVAGPRGLLPAWQTNAQSDSMQSYMQQLGGSVTPQEAVAGSPSPNFKSWYTGQDLGSTDNGWSTEFQQAYQFGLDDAYKRGALPDYFTQDNANGVVTWDNAKGAGEKGDGSGFKFGDVVVNGQWQGNVYQDFDRHTANVMMGDLMIQGGDAKARLNAAGDVKKAYEDEVTTLRANADQQMEVYPRAQQFEKDVKHELETDDDRGWIVAGGGTGGLALGAGIGSVIAPGLGTVIGGGIGLGVGLISSWLNSDSLTYQLARTQEQHELASKEGAGIQSALSGVAQMTMSVGLSPLQNLVQGTYDAFGEGGVTGGTIGGEFQETDMLGQRTASGWIQALDFAAMFGDSALQLGSPAGRLAYQAQMMTQISAGAMGLLPGQGVWDPTMLKQNSVWTNPEFNKETGKWEEHFAADNALAGIGNVAIDAVQLGGISSLSRGVDKLAASTAKATGQEASRFAKGLQRWSPANLTEQINLTKAQRAAVKAGGEIETRAGWKFVIDAEGKMVGKQKTTMAMLAPSEGLQAVSAKLLARRDIARRQGAVTAEELYTTASQLALGQRGKTAVLLNAVGEGQEEVAQAFLEPWSQDHSVDAETIIRAGLSGAVSGAGMTVGARAGRPSQDLQMYQVARIAHAEQTNGEELKYEDWQAMDGLSKRAMVKSATAMTKALADGAFAKMEADRINGTIGGVVEAAHLRDYANDERDAALKNGAQATDQASPIVMHESYTHRPEAIATSHTQLLQNQQDAVKGAKTQLAKLATDIKKAEKEVAANPNDTDAAARLDKARSDHTSLELELEMSQRLEATLSLYVDALTEKYAKVDAQGQVKAQDLAGAKVIIDGMNTSLAQMFDMSHDVVELIGHGGVIRKKKVTDEEQFALSKAVSRLITRDPADSTGSWQILLPQVNEVFAQRGADGLYAVSQIILKSIRGDYDGDKMRTLQQVVIDDKHFRDVRSGAHILGAELMPEIGSTKFEKQIATLVMQFWDSKDNKPLKTAARFISEQIEHDLKRRYGGRVDPALYDEITTEVQKALKTGGDVRKTVLTLMSQRAGDSMMEIGYGQEWVFGTPKLSNEWYWVANMVTQRFQEFQNAYAEYSPTKGDQIDQDVVTKASQTSTEDRKKKRKRGATKAADIFYELPGSNMFRMFQKLHYTLWETTEKFEGFATRNRNTDYMKLVQFYEQLSQAVTKQRQDRQAQSFSDEVVNNVLAQLEQMAADPATLKQMGLSQHADMALLANMSVAQVIYAKDDNGNRRMKYTGKQISLTQQLLYMSLQQFKKDNLAIWEDNADVSAAYNNLIGLTKPQTSGDESSFPGNAEYAFVRVFDSVRLYDLVGVEAVSLGVSRTVGQVFRELRNQSPMDRRQGKFALRSGGAYEDTEEKGPFTIPYGKVDVADQKVSVYKSVVDSLYSAADSSLTMNLTGQDKGKVHGRDAYKSDQRAEAFHEAYRAVIDLLQRLHPQAGPYTAEDITRIANEDRRFGQALMKVIPKSAMPWVFKEQREDGRVVFASWFYEVWTEPSAEQAEMRYIRNLITDSWYATVRNLDIDFTPGQSDNAKGIAFDRLESRVHRVMFNLASNSVGDEFPLKNFLTHLDEAKSVKEFFKWMNLEEGLADEGAPLLPWMDDVAEFDPERATGGWSQSLSTPTLMEHINNLKTTARAIIGDLDAGIDRSKSDITTARAIERWHAHVKDPDNIELELHPGDEDTYLQFVALLKKARKRRMSNGPRAMLQHTAHLVHGMYAPAHAKGDIADQMAANAALEAADNAIGYLTTAERVLGDLTAHNEDAVAAAPQMILRDGGRTMTRYGAQVQWELDTVDAMLPLMTDAKNHNTMRAILFDTVIELDNDNVARRKFLMGSTLAEVLQGNTTKDLFTETGKNPGLTKSLKYLSKMSQTLRDSEKHTLEQKVTELVLMRTTALDYSATFEEIQALTVQAYMDFAAVLQIIGRTKANLGEDDPITKAYEMLTEAAKVAGIANAYGIDPETIVGGLKGLKPLVQQIMIDPYQKRVEELALQLANSKRGVVQDQIRAQLKASREVLKGMEKKIARMFNLNVTDEIVADFFYPVGEEGDGNDAFRFERQTKLMEYVYEHGELMQAAGPAMLSVQAIKNHFTETKKEQKLDPFVLPEEAWETLSNVIISVEIQHLLTVGPASKPPPPYPAALKDGVKGLDKRKYWDHSFSYIYDFMSPTDTTGIVQAARDMAVSAGKVQKELDEEEVASRLALILMRPGSIGTWSPIVPIQAIESYDLLTGASAKPSISMHGLLSQRWGATMAATKREFKTDTVADSTVTLTAKDLDWMEQGQFHDVTIFNMKNNTEYKRPLAMLNNRFAEEMSFSYTVPGALVTPTSPPPMIDLMDQPNVARDWIPADGTVPAGKFKEVNITRIAETIELMIKDLHPNVDKDTFDAMVKSVTVGMRFVNPDNQSAEAKHANSVWHEGTVYYSNGDLGDSLITAFFYGIGGLNPRGQQAALDTRKLGLAGIEDYKRPSMKKNLEIEAGAGTDFSGMLAEKTRILMDTPISNGDPIDVHYWNAAYKLMKLKHWVDGTVPGTDPAVKQRWSAEQVIQWQMENPETDPNKPGPSKDFFTEGPLTNVSLWMPSDQVLADMMGDIGIGGVPGRLLHEEVTDDLTKIPVYKSVWTERMGGMFAHLPPATILDTDVARQSFVQDLKVSSYATPEELLKFQQRIEVMKKQQRKAKEQRNKDLDRTKTFDPVKNRGRNMKTALDWVAASDIDISWPGGFEFLDREQKDVSEKTKSALDSYMADRKGKVGKNASSFWIFQETGKAAPEEGLLTKENLGGKLNLVPGEVVFFDTASYQDLDPEVARKKALERIDFFVSRNVALMIGSSDGMQPLTAELQAIVMQEQGYQRYENNNNILIPDVFDESTFQNVAAARSRLTEVSYVPISRQGLSLLVADQQVEENTIWSLIRPGVHTKFDAIQATFDLFPIDVHSEFMTANTRDEAEKVLNRLKGLGQDGIEMLRKEATRFMYEEHDATKLKQDYSKDDVAEVEDDFTERWDAMMLAMPARVKANKTEPLVGEKFGTGDFVPLINSETGELLLYRHGYSFPNSNEFSRQLRKQTWRDTGERGIVMYSGKREKSATTHRGTVTGVHPSPGRGFRLEFEIPVQALGSKIVIEHNGMKYVRTNLPDHVKVPEMAVFGDRYLDGIASLHDVLSKEATGGLVTSFGNAFTTFGIDFKADVKKFFGTKNTSDAIKILKQVAAYGKKSSVEEIYELQSLLSGQSAYVSAITSVVQPLTELGGDTSWLPNIEDATPEAAIVRAMMVYLLSPGADVDFILETSGFFIDNKSMPDAVSRKMPELFTRAFDLSAPDSVIRVELERRINKKLNKIPGGNEGWHLDTNSWELEGRTNSGQTIRGMLQYGEAHVSEDNPLLNLMAQERKANQSATLHQGLMNRIGTGGVTRTKQKKLNRLTAIRQQNLTDPEQIKSMWRDLTFVDPATHGAGARWQRRTVAEHKFYNRSLMRMGQYRHAIDFTGDVFKNEEELLVQIQQAIKTIRNKVGLRPSQEEVVHYWLRQVMYHPAEGTDQDAFSGDLAPRDVLGATKTILGNLERGYLPTYDGAGPSFFSYHDLQLLFTAYQRNESTYAPWRKEGDRATKASKENIGEWISIAFAQGINKGVDFDPIYRLDFAGFMNTYQTVLKNSGYMMDITFDKEYQGKLLDPTSNEMLSVTIDPVENTRLREQVILATAGLDYDDLMNGATASSGGPEAMATATAWRQRRLDARARWRKRHAIRPVKVQSARDFWRNGIELINRDADMHSLQRIVIALRHGTAMLNPGLYFSMIPEQGFRMMLSEMTNVLTGTSTLKTTRAIGASVEATAKKLSGGRLDFQLGAYNWKTVGDLTDLFTTLGNDGGFTALIIKDMMWHKNPASPGRVVNWFETYAAVGNKWQDPTWGTTQKGLARHYVEAIMREVEANPTRYVMTIDSVIASLRTDPAFFAKNHPDLHLNASNAVVDFRSLKQTPMSLAFKRLYDPWTHSQNMGKRFVGTILKLNLMYMNYNMNVLTTITGMQGYTQLYGAFIHGAQTPNSMIKMWLKGKAGIPVTDDDYKKYDMSTALDGVDIANAFIKGGVTQTGLFMLGMVGAGLGLGGEDPEARRRRKLAQAQNMPLIMDPRKIENDFRNKDVIFMDWLPPQMSAFFKVNNPDGTLSDRAGVQMSWLVKPFLSPILGMERFFQTGDFDEVIHGFQDAISSMPMFNISKWDDAVRSAKEFEALASDEQETPTGLKNTMYLLTSAVGVLESMLVENMFVNSVYTGLDIYDRDPTKLVLRDSDGDPQKTIENNPRPNDLATQDFLKDDGTVDTGYMKRDPITGQLAAMTENNFTAAAVMSLFTGFQKDLMRTQMPVTERKINLPEMDPEEAKVAIMLATLNDQKAKGVLEHRLSLDEVTYMLKGQYMKKKDWDSYNNLDALALKFYNSDQNPVVDPLSVLGPNEQQIMTKSGHIALFKGLVGGTITLDDPLFKQIGISYDERKALETEFYQDFVRQGRDMGLPQSSAEFRATRLMVGPKDNSQILGFKDVLYDKRIPNSADAKYKQLNTTYVTGPDGFPWATGFKRGGAPGFGGFWSLLGGFKRPTVGMSNAITEDGRMNSVDLVRGIDTGMRGLVPMDPSEEVPTDRELNKMIVDAIKGQQANQAAYEPNSQESAGGGSGFYRRGYGRSSYGGGGGGKGYSPTIYWSRQPTLPRGTNVYGNSVKNLFWNNANIRRTTIRRERYQSSRERLNQWQ